jgi:E-phenylitaconyl-CoA hydratase
MDMSSLAGVKYEKAGPTAIITLDNPDHGNAMTVDMRTTSLPAVWAEVRRDSKVRVAIITGTGNRHFCTGTDVAQLSANAPRPAQTGSLREDVHLTNRHNDVWKPVICAVNGTVAGAGLHFVADADLVVASDAASFLDTHVNVGATAGLELIGLTKKIPFGVVMQMVLMGKEFRLSAQRAFDLGLVNELVPADKVLTTAMSIAHVIAANSHSAVNLSQRAMWASLNQSYDAAMEYAWSLIKLQRFHPDYVEGPRAFSERRAPNWA